MDWLRAAVELLEYLSESEGERFGSSYSLASTHLRAYFILRMGAVPDEPLLNLAQIVEWFRKSVGLSAEQALSLRANWSSLPIEEIRRLRDIKNILSVFYELARAGLTVSYPDIKQWLEIRDRLP